MNSASMLCLLSRGFVGIADRHLLDARAAPAFCCAALAPGVGDGDVQQDDQQEQESAEAPGEIQLREFRAEEGDLRVGGDVAQRDEREPIGQRERHEQYNQVGRADILDDGPEEAGKLKLRTFVHQGERLVVFGAVVGLHFFATEDEREQERLDSAEHHEQERAAPEVELVDRAGCKPEDGGEAADKGDGANRRDGLSAAELEIVFAEADQRLDDRNGAGDACEEEQGEPYCLQDSAEWECAEHVRHGLEAEPEGTELRAFLDVRARDDDRDGNDDRAADDDFGKAVRSAGGKGGENQVFLGLEVACVAPDDAHAEAHGKEHLACGRHPDLGISELAKVRVPHEGKPLADIRERKHAHHEDDAEDKQDGHANLVHALDALAHAEGEDDHIAGERDEEEENCDGDGAYACLEHDEVAEELRHRGAALGRDFHELARERVVGECEDPRLDEHVVENDEDGRQEADGTQVFCPRLLLAEDDVERARGSAVALPARVAAECPFHPRERDAQQEEGDEVGDDECATAVSGCLYRESKEVAEPDCRTGDSEDDSYFGAPVFTIVLHALKIRQSQRYGNCGVPITANKNHLEGS